MTAVIALPNLSLCALSFPRLPAASAPTASLGTFTASSVPGNVGWVHAPAAAGDSKRFNRASSSFISDTETPGISSAVRNEPTSEASIFTPFVIKC